MVDKETGVWKYLSKEKKHLYPFFTYVRQEELEQYQSFLMDENIIDVPNKFTISDKRQQILEHAINDDIEFLFMIDDDSIFYFREEELSSKYTSRHEDFIEGDYFNKILWESMCLCSQEYPIVGLPIKQGSFGLKYMFPKNIPVIRFVCLHVPTLAKEEISYNTMEFNGERVPHMQDRYVQLQLLEKGYRSISNCRFCIGDPGTNYKGGCSDVRTIERHEISAKGLAQTFPKTVSLKYKEDGHWGVQRLDCSIKWKDYLYVGESHYEPSEKIIPLFGEY